LRSVVEHAARKGCELLAPLGSHVEACGPDDDMGTVGGSEADRARADEPKVSGEMLAALNDLSGIYES
jgi:hypothetical protein